MREEEKQKSVRPLKTTKWYKQKRWIYPAVYLGFAAVVLAAVLWYQNDVNEEVQPNPGSETSYDRNQEAVPVNTSKEVFKMPVTDEGAVSIQTKFYDVKASAEEQQAALVVFNNQFFQSTGLDLVAKEGKTFDVTASLSGKVVKAEKDPILGYVVVLEHEDGVTTQYSSLKSVQVEEGSTVKQGEILGQAGVSEYNKEAGVHAHFEIRKDGKPVNPSQYFGQAVTAIPDQMQAKEDQKVDQESSTTDQSDSEDVSTEDETDVEQSSTQDDTEVQPSSNDEGTDAQESSTEPADGSSYEGNGTENHA